MKETGKKALTVLMALCMALTLMPQLAPNAAAAGGSLRTEALDLTVLDTDTVNTAEGWAWYAAASGDYSAKTLVLDGLNLQASDYYFGGLVLPEDSTIVLAEDSVNTVSYNYAASYGFYAAYGVFCNGSLTIQGDGAISVFSTTSSSIFNAGIYTASGNLTIESGTVTATALYGSNCYGLYSNEGVVISDGAVTASALNGTYCQGIYSYADVTLSGGTVTATAAATGGGSSHAVYVDGGIAAGGMAAKQKDGEGNYSVPATLGTGGKFFVYGGTQTADDLRFTPAPSFADSGDGSIDHPYKIGTAAQLRELAQFVNTQNEAYGDQCYALTGNIELGPAEWTPIGSFSAPFSGSLDGQTHTVSGLCINDDAGELQYCGLFGFVKGGTVKNLALTDASVTSACASGRLGGIAGRISNGAIENCTYAGTVETSGSSSRVGGIVGQNSEGQLVGCANTGTVKASGNNSYAGGVAGDNSGGHIQDCSNTGAVEASGNNSYAGGIAGTNQASPKTIVNCYNTGAVTVTVTGVDNEAYAGGITGRNSNASIRNCYSTGTVAGNASDGAQAFTGGIAGNSNIASAGVIEYAFWLSGGTVTNGIGYDDDGEPADTGCMAKSESEMKTSAFVRMLNETVTALESEYTQPSTWRRASGAENGGYPVFGAAAAAYTLTITGGGTGAATGGEYEEGAVVPISAGTKSGYTFSGWTSSGAGVFANAGSAETTFTMPGADVTITASWTANSAPGGGAPAPGGAQVIVNGQTQTAGTLATSTDSNGQTSAAVTLDTGRLQAILAAQESGATVIIPFAGSPAAASGILTGAMVKSMENKEATLVVQTASGAYAIPAAHINIDAVSRQLGTSVSLSDITVTISISSPSAAMMQLVQSTAANGGYTAIVPAVDYTITCEYGGQIVNVSGFNAYVERRIALPDETDPARITTGILVSPDGTAHHVPTRIIQENGKFYAIINSLTNSAYTVIWNPVEFSDMKGHWAREAVNDMGSRMIIASVGKNYEPNRSMTRAEFAAVLVRALGLEPGSGESGFRDIDAADWYSGAVQTATAYGLIRGYDNGSFGPNDTITREQAMTILARAMKLTGLNPALSESETGKWLEAYTDGTAVSAYAGDAVAACLKAGLVSGTGNNTLSPKADATRAELAVMVKRLLQKSGLI